MLACYVAAFSCVGKVGCAMPRVSIQHTPGFIAVLNLALIHHVHYNGMRRSEKTYGMDCMEFKSVDCAIIRTSTR